MMRPTPVLSFSGYGQAARLLRPALVDPALSPPATDATASPPRVVRSAQDVVDGLPLRDDQRREVLRLVGEGQGGYTVASALRRALGDVEPALMREVVARANRFAASVRAAQPRAPAPGIGIAAALGLRKGASELREWLFDRENCGMKIKAGASLSKSETVIAIGKHGGKIIGYAHGDHTRPIYADKNPHLTTAHVYPVGSGSGGKAVEVPIHDAHGPFAWTTHEAIAGGKPAVVHLLTGRTIKTVQPQPGAKGPKATASASVKLLAEQHGQVGLDAPPGGFVAPDDFKAMRATISQVEAAQNLSALPPPPAPTLTIKLTSTSSAAIMDIAAKLETGLPGSVIRFHKDGGAAAGGATTSMTFVQGHNWIYMDTANNATTTTVAAVLPHITKTAYKLGYSTVEVVPSPHASTTVAAPKPASAPGLVASPPAAPATPAPEAQPPLSKQAALEIVEKVSWHLNMPYEQVRAALTATDASVSNKAVAQARARIEHAILKLGHARKDAVVELLDGGLHDKAAIGDRIDAIGNGDKDLLKKEFAETPLYDLQVLKSATAAPTASGNGGVCTADRAITVWKDPATGKHVTGTFRHELGHAIMGSWGYWIGGNAPAQSPAGVIVEHHGKAVAKFQKFGKAPPASGFDHEWFEVNCGVIGKRALDNAHEDAAEHYRGYHREALRHRKKKGGQLDTYRQRHPEMAALWDAHYTAALLAAAAHKGVW